MRINSHSNESCDLDRQNGNTRGFTLIELLTVIAIIGILGTIILSVVGKVREQGRTAVCVSNLRQIGTALLTYAADNKDRLPVQNWWSNGAAPPALSIGGGTADPAGKSNGLGFLVSYGYLGGPQGVEQLSGPSKPQVLRCPNDHERFFNNQSASNWCSYVYQSPYLAANGATDPLRPNTVNVVVPQMALVTEAMQVFSNNPPPHSNKRTAVLYGGGQVMLRPWRGNSDGLSLDSQVKHFDLAPGLR